MTQQKEYTWEDLVAAVGQDFSGGHTQTGDPVERGWLRRFCEPIEMDCPLHHDDAVARQHGYQGIIAPVSMINQSLTTPPAWKPGEPTAWPNTDPDAQYPRREAGLMPPLPMPATSAGFATDIEIEYLAPVYVGDTLTSRGRKLYSVSLKTTSVGYGAFMVLENEIINQKGEVVAKCRNGLYLYNPHSKK